MPRVVFDTVVFVRALINPHGRWGQLVFQHFPRYTLIISRPVVVELLDVLRRPEVARRFRVFPGLDSDRLLALIGQAEVVDVGEVPLVSRDPNDNKLLAITRAAGVPRGRPVRRRRRRAARRRRRGGGRRAAGRWAGRRRRSRRAG
jgi:predicted nucleic acid-binding protein